MEPSRKVRVMIAEDNIGLCRVLSEALKSRPGIELVAAENDGLRAMQVALERKPDVLLLDLVLPRIEGFQIMHALNSAGMTSIRTIVLSSMGGDFTIQRAMQLGAYHFMMKPYDIDALCEYIVHIDPYAPNVRATLRDPEAELGELMKTRFGFTKRSSGADYLKAAVMVARDMQSVIGRVTKEIYPAVARLYGVKPEQVERSIRSAIDRAWTRGGLSGSNQYIGSAKPSNTDIIVALIEGIK